MTQRLKLPRIPRQALLGIGLMALFVLALFGRYEPKVAVSILLSGLTLGFLYFMVSAGLSLIFGLMDVLNFAHGTIFMLGAYLGLAIFNAPFLAAWSTDARFVLALIGGALSAAGVGALMEWSLIRPLYSRPIYQVLLTLGLTFVGGEAIKAVWGTAGFFMPTPAFFNTPGDHCPSPDPIAFLSDHCSSILVLGRAFPSYRLFVIGLGILMFLAVAILLRKTRLGIIIRAGVQDGEMVQALGINVRRIFTIVFALGAALAGIGGVAAAPIIGVNLGIGQEFLLQSFIAIVIGGMGSFGGATAGALLVGLARAFGDQLVLSGVQIPFLEDAIKMSPSIARASTVIIMALVLLIRPAGLFGKKD